MNIQHLSLGFSTLNIVLICFHFPLSKHVLKYWMYIASRLDSYYYWTLYIVVESLSFMKSPAFHEIFGLTFDLLSSVEYIRIFPYFSFHGSLFHLNLKALKVKEIIWEVQVFHICNFHLKCQVILAAQNPGRELMQRQQVSAAEAEQAEKDGI